MSKIALVTDSTASMPKELVDKYHISVAPQVLIWGNETFEDGVNITAQRILHRYQKSHRHANHHPGDRGLIS